MLKNRLDDIARVIEATEGYSNKEIRAWNLLSEHVDTAHFEKTGQIVTSLVSFEELLRGSVPIEFSTSDLSEAIQKLAGRGYVSAIEPKGAEENENGTRYRLYITSVDFDRK